MQAGYRKAFLPLHTPSFCYILSPYDCRGRLEIFDQRIEQSTRRKTMPIPFRASPLGPYFSSAVMNL